MAVVVSFVGKVDFKDLVKAEKELAKFRSQAEASGKSVGMSLGGLAKSAVGLGAAFGVGFAGLQTAADFLKGSFAEAQESIKTAAATAQIIKATGGAAKVTADQVGDLANRVSELVGVDDELVQQSANLILTFKNIKNEGEGVNAVFDRTVVAAQDLAAAGFGDAASAAKMLGKALNDPVAGLTALSRAGVTFSAQQKEQIKALAESGDVLQAQKVILAEVESQVGGVAAATATSADKFSVLWKNMQEALGLAVMPFLNALMSGLIPAVTGLSAAVSGASGFIAQNQRAVVLAVVAVGAFTVAMNANRIAMLASTVATGAHNAALSLMALAYRTSIGEVTALSTAMRAIPWVAAITAATAFVNILNDGAKAQKAWRDENTDLVRGQKNLVSSTGEMTDKTRAVIAANRFAAQAQDANKSAISGTVSSAKALAASLPQVATMTREAGDAAAEAATSFYGLMEAMINQDRADRLKSEMMKGISGTVSSAVVEGLKMGSSGINFFDVIQQKWQAAQDKIKSGASGTKSAMQTIEAQAISVGDALTVTIGKIDGLTKKQSERLSTYLGGMSARWQKEWDRAKGAFDRAAAYAQSWQQRLVGYLDMGKAFQLANDKDAREASALDALTAAQERLAEARADAAERIADARDALAQAETDSEKQSAEKRLADAQKAGDKLIAAAQTELGKAQGVYQEAAKAAATSWVDEFRDQLSQTSNFIGLLEQLRTSGASEALVSAVAAMGPEAGTQAAKDLINGSANGDGLIQEFSRSLAGVQEQANAAGITFANAWAENTGPNMGDLTAAKALTALKNRIEAQAKDVRKWIREKLATTVTVKVRYETEGSVPSVAGARAAGGPVSSGLPYLVGEAGPEVFVPSVSGTIIPNNQLTSGGGTPMGGGNTFNITVQAGVGDKREIGREVVEAIKAFERANSPVFASAV